MLDNQMLNDIKKLQEICEKHEKIKLKLNWDMLADRKEEENDFLLYENDELIAFLGLYEFGNKIEVCGMVHPEYRQKGIFHTLWHKALPVMSKSENILLNAHSQSNSAKKFLKTLSCTYSFSEYQMKYDNLSIPTIKHEVSLRGCTEEDVVDLAKLDVACFGFSMEEALSFTRRVFKEDRTFYLIETNNEVVGKISVQRGDKESWIYSFAIFPEKQGKGYGKDALLQILEMEKRIGNEIHLEVETENVNAKKLYEKCGFIDYDSQDYYLYNR